MDERAKARRADWAPDLGLVAAGGAQSGDSQQLAHLSHVLGGQHSGVERSLITISLHIYASGDTGDGLTAGQIRIVDKSVVEAGVDVNDLSVANVGTQLDLDLILLKFVLPGCHSASLLVDQQQLREPETKKQSTFSLL